ncbi:unknown [Clostridium sp. CAG:715]|nr:unknown [Clostridium sp. CAG:715]
MTMPALIANHRKTVLKTQFKKAYSELQQVNQNFIKDYDMNICEYNWQMWDETKSGYASSKATSDAFIEYYTGDGTSKSQILGSNQIKNLTGTKTVPQTLFDDGGAVDIQKRTFYFEYGVSNSKCPIISVDVNGYYKRPNQLGVDIFSFRPTKDGKIIPIGNPQTINDQINGSAVLGNNHSCTCTKKETDSITNGVCCAYWASIDINPDDNSKAYWKSFIQ